MTSATTSACPRGAPHRAPHLPWQHPVTSVPLPLPGPKRRHLPRWPRCLAAVTGCPETGQSAEATGSTGDWHRRLGARHRCQLPVPLPSRLCRCVPLGSLAPHSAIGSLYLRRGPDYVRLGSVREGSHRMKDAKAGGGGVKGRATVYMDMDMD